MPRGALPAADAPGAGLAAERGTGRCSSTLPFALYPLPILAGCCEGKCCRPVCPTLLLTVLCPGLHLVPTARPQ